MGEPAVPLPSQTLTLVRHFFGRFFDKEALSPQGEPEADLAQILGFLAVPGAFFVLFFRPFGLARWDLVTLRYFFVSFSMLIMALITVLQWDTLFPDRRDYQILTPLPLKRWSFLVAKVSALAIFLGLFLVDVNFFSVLLWPGMDGLPNQLAGVGVHLLVVLASGLFAALAVAAIQGLLVTVLSGSLLRRVSLATQTLLLAVLVMLIFLIPLMGIAVQPLARSGNPLIYYFPTYWFVGLYEQFRPATGHPVLLQLGKTGATAFWTAIGIFLLTYLPGYRRHARKVMEAPQPRPSGPGPIRQLLDGLWNRILLRDPQERAVFHFMSWTITRSMKHRLFLAVYGGFGAALGVMSLIGVQSGSMYLPRSGVAQLPLTLSFILVSGLRAAFNFPLELAANWTLQVNETGDPAPCFRAIRKWVAIYALIPLFVVVAPVIFYSFPRTTALFHLAFDFTLALLLTELLFLTFRKIPFGCSYLSGRANLVGLGVIYLAGFTLYSRTMAAVASWLTQSVWGMGLFFPVAILAIILANYWHRLRLASESDLYYEDAGEPTVRTLGLSAELPR